jgi:signal recognition particle GTPase
MDRAERDVRRMEGIICSMTPLERRKPELIKASRKRRIAAGAGVQVQEVNRLLNQFEQMQGMMKKMKGGGLMKMMRAWAAWWHAAAGFPVCRADTPARSRQLAGNCGAETIGYLGRPGG